MRATLASPGTCASGAKIPSASVCANSSAPKTGPSEPRSGAINSAILNKIREIYPRDTIKSLASWIDLTWKTAKNRVQGDREFTRDELVALMRSEHGFEIIAALMAGAPRKPRWWRLVEPLKNLADAEQMAQAARRRTQAVIQSQEETFDALATTIAGSQALVLRGPQQSRGDADALGSLAVARHRVVAAGRRR